jgi:hypothetical protein
VRCLDVCLGMVDTLLSLSTNGIAGRGSTSSVFEGGSRKAESEVRNRQQALGQVYYVDVAAHLGKFIDDLVAGG